MVKKSRLAVAVGAYETVAPLVSDVEGGVNEKVLTTSTDREVLHLRDDRHQGTKRR